MTTLTTKTTQTTQTTKCSLSVNVQDGEITSISQNNHESVCIWYKGKEGDPIQVILKNIYYKDGFINEVIQEMIDSKFQSNRATHEPVNVFATNLATATDSYKISHSEHQFPKGTTRCSYYWESRGGEYDETMVGGCNFIAKVLEQGITLAQVEHANILFKSHYGFDIFYYDAWKKIAVDMDGKLPLEMRSVKEGQVIPTKQVMGTLDNTDDSAWWLPGHLETFILRGTWYPTTTATISFAGKKVIKEYLKMTSDLKGEAFDFCLKTRLHDFGARGVSSAESAAIGGLAHLYNFIGTDTVEALILAQSLFNVQCAGISIPAREHSTTVCYGADGDLTPEQEDEAFSNSIKNWGDKAYAVVIDSKDMEAAAERLTTGQLKADIIEARGTCILRPDSGDMMHNIIYLLEKIAKNVGFTRNSKGYKVLHPSYRIIQGDGIDSADTIERILSWIETNGWSAENIAFGMGGGLLQKADRDTLKFAMKLSAIKVDGVWRDVRKCPKGAEWKASKAGRLTLIMEDGVYKTVDRFKTAYCVEDDQMVTYFLNGKQVHKDTLDEIRQRSDEQS